LRLLATVPSQNSKTGLGADFWELEREELFKILYPLILDAAYLGVVDGAMLLATGLVDISVVNQTVARWAALHAGELVSGITDTTRQDLAEGIADWIDRNGTLPELIDWVHTDFSFGLLRARRIAVTEVTNAYAQGNLAAWKNAGNVQGKRWLTAHDSKVCDFCGPLHDKRVGLYDMFVNADMGTQYNHPPAHPHCRCAIYPVVDMSRHQSDLFDRILASPYRLVFDQAVESGGWDVEGAWKWT
jgi:SPP1 gp7 family putative phage head morphogenesis protein